MADLARPMFSLNGTPHLLRARADLGRTQHTHHSKNGRHSQPPTLGVNL